MALRKSFSEDVPLTDVEKQERLLKTLACAVENLLISYAGQPPGTRAWDMLSGLSKVLDLIQTVLKDGSMYLDYRGQTECRSFVLEQAGSQMGMFGSSSIEGWLQLQLSNQCLTMKLRDLYSDRERVALHYTETSISMNPVFRQTFIFIIEALENLDLERLSTLDLTFNEPEPSKPVKKNSAPKLKQHRRSVSCPEVKDLCEPVVEELPSPEYLTMIKDLLENKESDESTISPQKTSSPVSNYENKVETKSVFVKGHNRAASDSGTAWRRPISPIFNCSDDLDSSQEIKGSWSQVVPATSGCYQRPKANQSLVSFLSESGGENARKGRRAQLDRENAHFILSEAMIGTLEQLHFDASMKRIDEQEESDDEIRDLKEKLRMRREEIYSSRSRKTKPRKSGKKISRRMPGMILSDGKTDPGTTDQSGSTDYNSEDSYEFEKMLDSNDEDYSKFERGSKDFVGSLSNIPEGSAESIALSLLGQIGAGRLPPADQLPWLVSEEDAPQQLLPLPDSLPVDPEDDLKGATALRGNLLWAPPRPQLVLTVQYKPKNRKAAMYLQKWQCSGCGMKVEQKYSKSYRFCNYLGKFFCTGCHENTGAIIPARVIQDWDFKRYPVSNFSLDILNSMHTEPVFNIQDLNPDIIRKIEKLRAVCMSRLQMNKLSRYISTCKHAVHLQSRIEEFLCPDPYLFSMEQLVSTRFNKLGYTIRSFVGELLKHVQECDLCQAKGFICEGCRSGASIFPFQFGVHECICCYACYHSNCFSTEYGCTRCKRLEIRQALEPVVC